MAPARTLARLAVAAGLLPRYAAQSCWRPVADAPWALALRHLAVTVPALPSPGAQQSGRQRLHLGAAEALPGAQLCARRAHSSANSPRDAAPDFYGVMGMCAAVAIFHMHRSECQPPAAAHRPVFVQAGRVLSRGCGRPGTQVPGAAVQAAPRQGSLGQPGATDARGHFCLACASASSVTPARLCCVCAQAEQDTAAEQSALVNQAYDVLKSPLKRALHLVRSAPAGRAVCRPCHSMGANGCVNRQLEREGALGDLGGEQTIEDMELLQRVLEAREQVEAAAHEADLAGPREDNRREEQECVQARARTQESAACRRRRVPAHAERRGAGVDSGVRARRPCRGRHPHQAAALYHAHWRGHQRQGVEVGQRHFMRIVTHCKYPHNCMTWHAGLRHITQG